MVYHTKLNIMLTVIIYAVTDYIEITVNVIMSIFGFKYFKYHTFLEPIHTFSASS